MTNSRITRGRRSSHTQALLTGVLLMVSAAPLLGAVPADQWLPEDARFFLSIPDFQQARSLFAETAAGRYLNDPAMEPFLRGLPAQLRKQARASLLGLVWVDLRVDWSEFAAAAGGEVAWAVLPWKNDAVAMLVADVTGRAQQVDQLRDKIDAAMQEQGGARREEQVEGTRVTIYTLPEQGGAPGQSLVCFVRNDVFVATGNAEFAESLLDRVGVAQQQCLAKVQAYQQVMIDCQKLTPDKSSARLFAVPLDLIDLIHRVAERHDVDAGPTSNRLRSLGFGAVQGVGATITIAAGDGSCRFAVSVNAPKPWVKSMQMVDLRNGRFVPAPWVPDDAACCNVMNLEAASVYGNLGSFFDEIVANGAEGTWNDVLESLREEPDGPHLDLEREVFAFLTGPVIVFESESLPVTPESPQVLLAIRSTDEQALAAGIRKAMQDDPVIENRTVAGTTVYYCMARERTDVPLWIMAVARGHLFMTTDFSILSQVLEPKEVTSLAADPVYRQSVEPLMTDSFRDVSMTVYYRLDRWLQVRHELLRAGQARAANRSLLGMINSFLGGEPLDEPKPALDGSQLPPFEQVRKYFGVLAAVAKTTENGWQVSGRLLPLAPD